MGGGGGGRASNSESRLGGGGDQRGGGSDSDSARRTEGLVIHTRTIHSRRRTVEDPGQRVDLSEFYLDFGARTQMKFWKAVMPRYPNKHIHKHTYPRPRRTLPPLACTLRFISLSPRSVLQWPEEQSRSGCGQIKSSIFEVVNRHRKSMTSKTDDLIDSSST